jgi:asparagine synthase (glutamine-hydrolysing)
MCGICGIVSIDNQNNRFSELVNQMTDSMSHRGPDEEGFHLDGHIALGVRRLSIIDIKNGNQPIYNEDKSLVIIFNGEIYNHNELKAFLENKGHIFNSSSDTETILHLYEEFGRDCCKKCVTDVFFFIRS